MQQYGNKEEKWIMEANLPISRALFKDIIKFLIIFRFQSIQIFMIQTGFKIQIKFQFVPETTCKQYGYVYFLRNLIPIDN